MGGNSIMFAVEKDLETEKAPSITRLCPLMYRASSLHRNSAAWATSSASNLTPLSSATNSVISPTVSASKVGSTFFMVWTNMGVGIAEGDTQLARMPYGAKFDAATFIMPTIPCLDAGYAADIFATTITDARLDE
eukprot:Gb_05033 [translate_table: standard]